MRLIDFDFAGVKLAGEAFLARMNGSPVYEAPEVIRNNYDEKCDIWAIGCLLYFMLSGTVPFRGNYA